MYLKLYIIYILFKSYLFRKYGSDSNDVIIWFDLFCNNQHPNFVTNKPFEWWRDTFSIAIGKIGKVLMIMLPMNNPITLLRAWCVFEIYACETSGALFDIGIYFILY